MMKKDVPTLYHAPGSCSLAALIALYETGMDFDAVPVFLAKGEQHLPEYRSINPRAQIPALVAEGQVVTELVAVLTWIAHSRKSAGLLPFEDVNALAQAYKRMNWYASSLHVAIAQCWRTERFTGDQDAWPAIKQGGRATIERGFEEIDAMFEGPWVLGDAFSVVDGYTHIFWRWGERLEIEMPRYSRWAAARERLLARPAVLRALETEAASTKTRILANG